MKVLTRYICELCGSRHTGKDKAEKCEQSHIAPQKIVRAQYECNAARDNYPVLILVEMSDGTTVVYKR